jgi:hypothetical protein
MVKAPVVTTFATAEPESIPMNPDAKTDALAGPPRVLPNRPSARLIKKSPPLDCSRKAAKMTNMTMKVADTPAGIPHIPSVV